MYLGEINHRDRSFPAEHEAIVEKELFDAVQDILNQKPNRNDTSYTRSNALLAGLLFDDRGITRDNCEVAKARELGDDVLRQAVGEVLLLRITAHILKRQDGN
jgi:hypothetical protein